MEEIQFNSTNSDGKNNSLKYIGILCFSCSLLLLLGGKYLPIWGMTASLDVTDPSNCYPELDEYCEVIGQTNVKVMYTPSHIRWITNYEGSERSSYYNDYDEFGTCLNFGGMAADSAVQQFCTVDNIFNFQIHFTLLSFIMILIGFTMCYKYSIGDRLSNNPRLYFCSITVLCLLVIYSIFLLPEVSSLILGHNEIKFYTVEDYYKLAPGLGFYILVIHLLGIIYLGLRKVEIGITKE